MVNKNNKFDVIVIGAGISGLVAGCYLTKYGFKTLLIEKNEHVGGCCTTFLKNGFKFDACVHSLGSCRNGGVLFSILTELNILEDLKLMRFDPSDIFMFNDFKFSFKGSLWETEQALIAQFPKEEEGIQNLFCYIRNTGSLGIIKNYYGTTFEKYLDSLFDDVKLKAILSVFILGNAGLPPSRIDASRAIILLKEFLFDGGYYPKDGIDAIPGCLARKYLENGGELAIKSNVTRIILRGNRVTGVVVDDKEKILANIIVCASDMTRLFNSLLFDCSQRKKTRANFIPSLSALTIYLGNSSPQEVIEPRNNLWILPSYNIEKMYQKIKEGNIDDEIVFALIFQSSSQGQHKSISRLYQTKRCVFVNAPYKNKDFWIKYKQHKSEKILAKALCFVPQLKNFEIQSIADPLAVNSYTANFRGAAYGWAPHSSQSYVNRYLGESPDIKGLYFSGHWTTEGHGIPSVAFSGKRVAGLVRSEFKR